MQRQVEKCVVTDGAGELHPTGSIRRKATPQYLDFVAGRETFGRLCHLRAFGVGVRQSPTAAVAGREVRVIWGPALNQKEGELL